MYTFVGFLRLANYICACNAAFGLTVSLFWPEDIQDEENEFGRWRDRVYYATGWIQVHFRGKDVPPAG